MKEKNKQKEKYHQVHIKKEKIANIKEKNNRAWGFLSTNPKKSKPIIKNKKMNININMIKFLINNSLLSQEMLLRRLFYIFRKKM